MEIAIIALANEEDRGGKSALAVAAADSGKSSACLFAYFTGNGPGEERIRFAVSEDGFNYKALNGNRPILDSRKISSTGGTRDRRGANTSVSREAFDGYIGV